MRFPAQSGKIRYGSALTHYEEILMKKPLILLNTTLAVLFITSSSAIPFDKKLPVVGGQKVVASIGGEYVSLKELDELASSEKLQKEEKEPITKKYAKTLKWIISTKLILLEARNMGLNELPETKKMVEGFSRDTLRDLVKLQIVKGIKADEKEVEKLYNELIKEYKIKSVVLEDENEIKEIESQIKSGSDFDELAKKLKGEGKTKEPVQGISIKARDIGPEIAEIISKMDRGSISPILPLDKAFAIIKLEEVSYTDEPQAREAAEQYALQKAKAAALTRFYNNLKVKSVRIDNKLLESVDFEAGTQHFQELAEDSRVVARIQGAEPVTVGYLTSSLKMKFYHGLELATEGKKLNKNKEQVLEEIIQKRLFLKEALKRGIGKSDKYKKMVKEYEDSLIFDAFVRKVIAPDINIVESDFENYYNEHIEEYSQPAMAKMTNMAFHRKEDAEWALNKSKEGADLKWVKENASGQIDKNKEDVLKLAGRYIIVSNLPAEMQKVIQDSKANDYKLHESPEGYFYVTYIEDIGPSNIRPLGEVREDVIKKAYNNKLKKKVEDTAEKLKKFYKVSIYAKELE